MKIMYADQSYPYMALRRHKKGSQELINIVRKNIPDISIEEIVEMFKDISNNGCSAANLANIIASQIEISEDVFGFSLIERGNMDYNKLLVDIYSKLYRSVKAKFIEYERHSFSSNKEALESLFNKQVAKESEANLELFQHGYVSDGFDSLGQLKFKSKIPVITEDYGDIHDIAKRKFGLDNIYTIEELLTECQKRQIDIEIHDKKIFEKLSGLFPAKPKFWIKYYLSSYGDNYDLDYNPIYMRNYKDYYSFVGDIISLMKSGYMISVSSPPNSEAQMHGKGKFSWSKISEEKAGHAMMLKRFSEDGDLVITTYGKEYIIPKEFFSLLEYKKVLITNKKNTNKRT